MKSETYEEFVEKFKPKKTTDDCYTPPDVYECVLQFVKREYNIDNCRVVRPFYPGGDYEGYTYAKDCVVVDNPPFSILSKIIRFYKERDIKFFLFAPALTLFGYIKSGKASAIICGANIVYENGAVVPTSFLTNLDKTFIRTAPDLLVQIEKVQKQEQVKAKRKYAYPDNAVSSALLQKIARVPFAVDRKECYFIRALDEQRERHATLYGAGFLLSDAAAKRYVEAQQEAQQFEKQKMQKEKWHLSPREREIVNSLSSSNHDTIQANTERVNE